jgi:anti-sigma factor RsiW
MTLLAYLPGTSAWRRRRKREICRQTAERIEEIVDGELPPTKAARVLEQHLIDCPPCRDEAEVVRALKGAIARVSGEADPEVVDRLQDLARRLCEGRDNT